MGIFSNYYLKEGPGIDPNAPKKTGMALFFDILFRKFFDLLKANMLYFIVSLPFFAILMFLIAPIYANIFLNLENVESGMQLIFYLIFTGVLFNFVGSGPASAAYSFVTRSFTRSVPVWVASDGFDKFRENFKQSILLVIVDIAVLYIMAVAINFYGQKASFLFMYLRFFMILLLTIYLMAHTFAYQIMVTYNCKFKDIIKNSLIMTMAKLPMCLLLSAVEGIICFLIFAYFSYFGVLIYAIIGMSVTKFPLEFYTARVIEKNIEEQQNNQE